jgi:MFS family permease
MRRQVGLIVAFFVFAMIALPYFYGYRMNDLAFTGGVLAFIGVPLIAGLLQTRVRRPVMLLAAILLILCPVVYALTDRMSVEFEKLRDGYFLGVGIAIIFVAAAGLIESYKTGKRGRAVAASLCLASAAAAVSVLLWLVIYLE